MLTLGQIRDSSLSLYSQDPWSFFDIAMVLIFGNPLDSPSSFDQLDGLWPEC